jgi:sterol desaturase/sphingolipid hydroxylase (fatty acid hydroxylase superfamily)
MSSELIQYFGENLVSELILRFLVFFVPATLIFVIVNVILRKRLNNRKIQQRPNEKSKITYDIIWTAVNRFLLTFVTVGIAFAIAGNFTLIYTDINEFGIIYFVFSIILVFLIHDTYFYFMHRLMHNRTIYKYVHKVHHHSTDPTVFTSYTFHPLETIIEFAFLPLIIFIIPLHPIAFAIWQFGGILLFTMYAHLGYEIMPKFWVNNPITKYFNTPTHHNMHHAKFNYNYGLYFNFWDRIFKTQHQEYDNNFNKIVNR